MYNISELSGHYDFLQNLRQNYGLWQWFQHVLVLLSVFLFAQFCEWE